MSFTERLAVYRNAETELLRVAGLCRGLYSPSLLMDKAELYARAKLAAGDVAGAATGVYLAAGTRDELVAALVHGIEAIDDLRELDMSDPDDGLHAADMVRLIEKLGCTYPPTDEEADQ